MVELQVTETKAKEISKELKNKYGIIASPEDVKEFSLGLGLRGEYPHSKKELIHKFLSSIHGEISSPQVNLYERYMSSQPKRKEQNIPEYLKY